MDLTKLLLWDVASGKCLRSFEGHKWHVLTVAFSPDGRRALSGSLDKTLRLWDVASGTCLRSFEGHTGWVPSATFSPDGRQALSGSLDETLRLWDVAIGTCLRSFEGHTRLVTSVAFSPDGRMALSGNLDYSLWLWSLGDDWTERGKLQLAEPEPLADLLNSAARRASFLSAIDSATKTGRLGEALQTLSKLEAQPGHNRHPETMAARDRLATRCRRGASPCRLAGPVACRAHGGCDVGCYFSGRPAGAVGG